MYALNLVTGFKLIEAARGTREGSSVERSS